jgi:hypothetical protein
MNHEWRKSSFSGGNPNCLECRADYSIVEVRDSMHREAGHLEFPAREFAAFLADVERL